MTVNHFAKVQRALGQRSTLRAAGRSLWHLSAIALLLTSPTPSARAAAPATLLSNPDFAADRNGDLWPDDWPRVKGATWEKEEGRPFLRLRSETAGETIMLYRSLILPSPLPPALEIHLRVRYADIQPGKQAWFDARVISHFKDAAAKVLNPDPPTPSFKGTSKGWVEKTYIAKVPSGAHLLELMPCLFQVARGTLDLALLEVRPATADQLPKPPPVILSTTLAPTNAASLPPELHTDGNKLRTSAGKAVWLQGLCVDSLQWSGAGEHIQQSIPVAIEQWKANVIRLPVTEAFWFGRDKWQKDGGVGYRKVVDAAVEAAAARGAYLALDLHRFGAPKPEHAEFWKDAATRYRNHPAVLFELFNEAHSISWPVWRDGGDLKSKASAHADVNAAENKEAPSGDQAVGMQTLLEIVRATGARNLVIVGGLDWGYDLSGVAKTYALQDRAGAQGVIYSSHIYPWKTDWQGKVLEAAAKFPIFVGEVGCPPDWKSFEFIPPSARQDLPSWPPDVLGLIQKHKLHWTGFSFHPTCAPNVIQDWNYTPTPYWGAFVKEALSGKQYELKKMR